MWVVGVNDNEDAVRWLTYKRLRLRRGHGLGPLRILHLHHTTV
jgi:hypothetical protein